MRVGYLGPRGTFSEEASLRYFEGQDVDYHMYPSILDVLDAVQEQEIDFGVVPIENSIEGSVTMTLDGLSKDPDLFIVAEVVLPIEQNLLANVGTLVSDIREIWSHPQALAQCRDFIRGLGARGKAWDSTASAAAEVAASGRKDVGAIGNSWAAKKFGLVILQSNLQDASENHTRFVVVRREEKALSDADKSMLLVTLNEERAGALVHVLNVFAALNLNLTRLESRPTRKKLGTYQFFIDVEAGWQHDHLQKAISVIGTFGHQVRVLGSYRKSKKI
ncbi:prephenate dehydratase [Effusibacillus lacus]|uniref:Prephenate dehydratase n=1 Tax=Effusibacillus lacus TaxID=1348429 RepID=A0A292YSU1_9BACL|nr:prephenate dehydratase [Effusibacillus lacus]TCS68936.1 prephenate dehydratase [Effusibacillus lacus]GAX91494.1 prephenate dehydratase [Effusibacillus lacus]